MCPLALVSSLVCYKYLLRNYSEKRNRRLILKIFYNLLTYESREIRFNGFVRVRVLTTHHLQCATGQDNSGSKKHIYSAILV